jgi:transketolase
MALASKMDKLPVRVYCLMGDGETNEGQIWEAAMTAAHYRLDNLCGIVDLNGMQIDGFCRDVKNTAPMGKKWESFGWQVIEIDGHDFKALMNAFDAARGVKGRPTVLICRTIKGKGVTFMENRPEWHGVAPKSAELEKALKELEESI